MKWNEQTIRYIIADMAEENAFACQALFRITRVQFTDKVPTLAVSLSAEPLLYINRNFLEAHAETEDDIKSVLMHEFLHVVLQHTENYKSNTPLLNIALDAIINSIIHRTYGEQYSSFFRRLYQPKGIECLLRTWEETDPETTASWKEIHTKVYNGSIAAEDLLELFRSIAGKWLSQMIPILLGNHEGWCDTVSEENRKILEGIIHEMDGTRIWNKPKTRGMSDMEQLETRRKEQRDLRIWERETRKILQTCLQPDPTRLQESPYPVLLPVISTGDRRAFATIRTNSFIPFSGHEMYRTQPSESVNVYLDVSGSMNEEIDRLLTLLAGFRKLIRRPLWVFSNKVEQAYFRDGRIEYKSTGGTSISCVFDHIRQHGFQRSLIVTDGYTEKIEPQMLVGIPLKGLCVLLSAKGEGHEFQAHNIRHHQLKNTGS